MTRNIAAAALAGVLVLAGCGGDGATDIATDQYALEATSWSNCQVEDTMPQDMLNAFTFVGNEFHRVKMEYESYDGSCTGVMHGSVSDAGTWTFTLGRDIGATLEGAPVTAQALDFELGDGTPVHSVLYVDSAPVPDVLYIGDPGQFGATPETRGTVLWASLPMTKEDVAGVTAPALQGTWLSCATAGIDHSVALTIRGYTYSLTYASHYASSDGSCGTPPTIDGQESGAFVLRDTNLATLGASSVTARAVDVVTASSSVRYTLWYVNDAGDALYMADHLADPLRDGTDPGRRPSVLEAGKPLARQ